MGNDDAPARCGSVVTRQNIGDVLVGQSMKTIAAHAPIGDRGRQGKRLRDGVLRAMKCRIEARHLRELWRSLGDGTDGLQVVRLV